MSDLLVPIVDSPYSSEVVMSDLIERLRDPTGLHFPRCREAADEIERLTGDLQKANDWRNRNELLANEYAERIAKLEAVRDAAKKLTSVHKPKDFAPSEIVLADRELRAALKNTEVKE